MKIIKLSSENIKRVSAVEITPEGSMVVIGGKNDAGKSSVLDSIAMALGGADLIPGEPVRTGQERGKVVVDLGDLVVTRTFTASGGGSLIVANKDGARFPSPQAVLDRLLGALTFDPLAFERQDEKTQALTLAKLVGFHTDDLDDERSRLYQARTAINRDAKFLKIKADAAARFPDAPPAAVSIEAIVGELEVAETDRKHAERAAKRAETFQADSVSLERTISHERAAVARMEVELAGLRAGLVTRETEAAERVMEYAALVDVATEAAGRVPDTDSIRQRLKEAEVINGQVRANAAKAVVARECEAAEQESARLTERMFALDVERTKRLEALAFPVEGLTLDERGVVLNDLPFNQASTSSRLRVSVAIGLAMNPTLRVLLVRDGSLLDSHSLQVLGDMAEAADAQVWVEMMQEEPTERTSVFIEDGTVRA